MRMLHEVCVVFPSVLLGSSLALWLGLVVLDVVVVVVVVADSIGRSCLLSRLRCQGQVVDCGCFDFAEGLVHRTVGGSVLGLVVAWLGGFGGKPHVLGHRVLGLDCDCAAWGNPRGVFHC